MKPKSKRPPLSAHLEYRQSHQFLKMQDEDGINFTDSFILSAIEIARKEEKSSQAKKEKSSSQKIQAK